MYLACIVTVARSIASYMSIYDPMPICRILQLNDLLVVIGYLLYFTMAGHMVVLAFLLCILSTSLASPYYDSDELLGVSSNPLSPLL